MHCHKCGKDTHQHDYVQYFYNVNAISIVIQQVLLSGQALGLTLKEIENQSQKSCDTDKGMIADMIFTCFTQISCTC